MFDANADKTNAIKMAKYMRNQFTFYGIATPKRRKMYIELIKADKKRKGSIGICSIYVIKNNVENFNILSVIISIHCIHFLHIMILKM